MAAVEELEHKGQGGHSVATRWSRRRMVREFEQMLAQKALRTIYQPVVLFDGSEPIGYEALSRGPVVELASPLTLFKLAQDTQATGALDQLCCELAIKRFPAKNDATKLAFINVVPESLEMEAITADKLTRWTDEAELDPHRVVLEITERIISDPARFYQEIGLCRQRGFQFAVDDLGTGQSNLGLVADLVPGFLKLDLEFVRLTRVRPVRQLLIEALVRFSDQIGASIVAEGIESVEDAEVFQTLGVPLGQGYLYRPA